MLFNTIAAILVNGSYVFVLLTQSSLIQSFTAVLLSIFKLVWSERVLLPFLKAFQCSLFLSVCALGVNNILIPIIATTLVDVDCYRSVFISPDPVTVMYPLPGFSCEEESCRPDSSAGGFSFTPAFIYGGQCSSAILTNYVPIYVLMYGVVGVMVPFLQITALRYLHNCVHRGEIDILHRLKSGLNFFGTISGGILCSRVLPLERVDELRQRVKNVDSLWKKPFYGARHLALNAMTMLLVLFTFGLAYPPLAVMILVSVTMQSISVQLSVHYHHRQVMTHDAEWASLWNEIMQLELEDLPTILFDYKSYYLAFLSCSVFVSCFLVDMTISTNSMLSILLPCVLIVCVSVRLYTHSVSLPTAGIVNIADPQSSDVYIELQDSGVSDQKDTKIAVGSSFSEDRITNPLQK